MRRPYDSLQVPLSPDVRRKVYRALFDDCRRTVQANQNRDYDLFQLRQQLEGVSQPGGDANNPNSCQLEDTLPRELHTTAHANICSALRQKPYITFEALRPELDQVVTKLETLANTELQLFGFDAALATLAYIACESRFTVCCVEYATSFSKHKFLKTEEPLDGEDEEGAEAEPLRELWQRNEATERFEFRSIDPWDFYLSPVGSQRAEKCDRIYERLWMSRSSLLDGVRNEGFDADEVAKLLKGGPTAIREGFNPRSEQMLLEGVQEDVPGFYECYKVTGRIPYVLDAEGNQVVPDQFLDEDYVWYICPERDICFKHIYNPYPVRPYATGKALGPEDQLIGHGIVSAVSAIADELTIMLRAAVDSVNFNMDPQVKVPESQMGWYSQKDIRGAGRFLPYRGPDPNVIQEVHRDFAGLQVGLEVSQTLYNRAQRMVAAEGVNAALSGRAYKAAQIEFADQVMRNKFGLILYNFSRLVEDIVRIYMAMRKHTLPQNHFVRQGNQTHEINTEDFDAAYKIVPHADPDNASSAARLQRDVAIISMLRQSPLYQQRVAMGDFEGEWLMLYHFLSHSGIQNPESIIGPQPAAFDPMAVLQRIFPIVMQGAQAGDPVAQSIIQTVQQLAQQASQGMPQGAGMRSGVVPGAGLNLPVLPAHNNALQGAFATGNGVA